MPYRHMQRGRQPTASFSVPIRDQFRLELLGWLLASDWFTLYVPEGWLDLARVFTIHEKKVPNCDSRTRDTTAPVPCSYLASMPGP